MAVGGNPHQDRVEHGNPSAAEMVAASVRRTQDRMARPFATCRSSATPHPEHRSEFMIERDVKRVGWTRACAVVRTSICSAPCQT